MSVFGLEQSNTTKKPVTRSVFGLSSSDTKQPSNTQKIIPKQSIYAATPQGQQDHKMYPTGEKVQQRSVFGSIPSSYKPTVQPTQKPVNPKIAQYQAEAAQLGAAAKKAGSIFGIAKNAVKASPKALLNTFQQAGQSAFRGFGAVGAKIAARDINAKFTPQGKFQKELYGTDSGVDFTSVGQELTKRNIPILTPALGGFIAASDAIPGGQGAKKGIKGIIKAGEALDESIAAAKGIIKGDARATLAAAEARTGVKPVQAAKKIFEVPEEPSLADKKAMLKEMQYAMNEMPENQLTKYVQKKGDFKGQLPEVTGNSKTSIFKREGDAIVHDVFGSKSTTEEVRERMGNFIKDKENLKQLENDLKVETRAIRPSDAIRTKKPQISDEGIPLAPSNARQRALIDGKIKPSQSQASIERARKMNILNDATNAARKTEEVKQSKIRNINKAFETPSTGNKKFKEVWNGSFAPVKNLDEESQNIFKEWNRATINARELGNREAATFNTKNSMQSIHDFQGGITDPEVAKKFDDLFRESNVRGIETKYRENYIPQVYKETPEEIKTKIAKYLTDQGLDEAQVRAYMEGRPLDAQTARRLNLNTHYAQERTLPTYAVASKYGLTPKYTNISQLGGHYRQELEKAVANKKFIEQLSDSGKILPVEHAPSSWQAVNLPFSTKGYYAEPKLAKVLNNIFRNTSERTLAETITHGVAKGSKLMQEIALSAGIPGTTVNFFTMGQTIKEMTAGNFKAIIPFLRANFNEASIKYFQRNQKYLELMAKEGLDLGSHIANYDGLYKNLEAARGWKEVVGDTFSNLFNKKTFGSFMPQLHLQTFKGVYEKALRAGKSEIEAQKLAGDTTKNAFGLMENMARGSGTEDKLSAIFFAPRFREGIINTLSNTGKAGLEVLKKVGGLRGALNPALAKNRKLLAGMILTYGAYNLLNKKLNGNYMWDNPSGKEFALQIPSKDGSLVYVEFMPSFLAFARNMIHVPIALAKGDFNTAGQKFGSLFSMPLKTGADMVTNRDYFGNEIFKDTDSTGTKIAKEAGYVVGSFNHPFIKEGLKQAPIKNKLVRDILNIPKKKPSIFQSLVVGAELPLKFSSVDSVNQAKYYDMKDEQTKINAKEKARIQPIYDQVQELLAANQKEQAMALVANFTEEDKEIYKKIKTADKTRDTKEKEMKMYPLVVEIQDLLAQGRREEALDLVKDFTEEDRRIYKLVKDKLPK